MPEEMEQQAEGGVMARPRIRSMKPEFCWSEAITALEVRTRLHFAMLWTHCDDEGRAKDNARLIKAAIWPLDDDVTALEVDAMQDELERAGRIIRYEVDGVAYFEVVNWREHQKPQHPKPSDYPPPPDATDTSHADRMKSQETYRMEQELELEREREREPASGAAAAVEQAVEIIAARRDLEAIAATKNRPNRWLAGAKRGLADDITNHPGYRDGMDADELAELLEPPPPRPPTVDERLERAGLTRETIDPDLLEQWERVAS